MNIVWIKCDLSIEDQIPSLLERTSHKDLMKNILGRV